MDVNDSIRCVLSSKLMASSTTCFRTVPYQGDVQDVRTICALSQCAVGRNFVMAFAFCTSECSPGNKADRDRSFLGNRLSDALDAARSFPTFP